MGKSLITFALTAFLFLAVMQPGTALASGQAEVRPDAPMKILVGMESAYAKVDDYTANFLKRERVGGELLPEEDILLKFRKPFMVYMKWREGPHGGREALYVQGKNSGKVVGHEGGFFGFITLNMEPRGGIAMKGNRHPITDVGIGRLIEIVMENTRRAGDDGALKFTYSGEEEVLGRNAYRIIEELPAGEDKGYYCRKLELWVDKELGLPIKIIIYGWRDEILERYGYRDLKLNPGLSDSEFDRGYKDYGF